MSLTAKTLDMLRKDGWTADVVEYWHSFAKIRKDLFQVIDIVAVNGQSILAVQSTSYSNKSARFNKIKASYKAKLWVQSGGQLWIVAWKKVKLVKNGKAFRYEPFKQVITLDDFT